MRKGCDIEENGGEKKKTSCGLVVPRSSLVYIVQLGSKLNTKLALGEPSKKNLQKFGHMSEP